MTKDEANASPKDAALRLALEALKEIIHWYAVRDRNDVLLNFVDQNPEIKKAMTAITAIEAALEAKDELVVWNEGVPAMLPKQKEGETFIVSYEPKLEAKDEPVAWMDASRFEELRNGFTVMTTLTKKKAFFDDVAIYTTLPQRKPLTDEEIKRIWESLPFCNGAWETFARAIEAAHGIKEEA